jgi:hypothetical protein
VPHQLVLRQHAGAGALLGIDPALQAVRHGRRAAISTGALTTAAAYVSARF